MNTVFSLKEKKTPPHCPCFGCTFREKRTSAQPPSPAALRISQVGDKLRLTKGVTLHWKNETALIPVSTLIPHSGSFNCNHFKCIKLHQTKAMSLPNEGVTLVRQYHLLVSHFCQSVKFKTPKFKTTFSTQEFNKPQWMYFQFKPFVFLIHFLKDKPWYSWLLQKTGWAKPKTTKILSRP